MRKTITGVLGAALIAVSGLSATTIPAMAQGHHSRSYYVQSYCDRHPGDPDCHSWRSDRHRWGNRDYRRFYQRHESAFPAFVGGLFGFALGAAIANSANQGRIGSSWSEHVARCEARYRSYNPRTDSYLGYDGQYHRCTL